MYADVFVDGEKYEEYGYLEINLSGGQSVNIPPFIKVLKDVSDDQNYDNYTKAVGEKSAELKKRSSYRRLFNSIYFFDSMFSKLTEKCLQMEIIFS